MSTRQSPGGSWTFRNYGHFFHESSYPAARFSVSRTPQRLWLDSGTLLRQSPELNFTHFLRSGGLRS